VNKRPSFPDKIVAQVGAWRKSRRLTIQITALVVALLAPFGLHWSLEAGRDPIAVFFFGLLALAMLLTAWVG